MTLKQKALLYNFLAFAILFLIFRFGLTYLFAIEAIYVSLVSAVIAMVLAPKFAVAHIHDKEKLMMKWIFIKGVKEV